MSARPKNDVGKNSGHAATAANVQKVLLVDDDRATRRLHTEFIESSIKGVKVVPAESGAEALKVLSKDDIDLIVADYRMPGMDGLEFLEKARSTSPTVPRILLTGYPDIKIATRAINEAGVEYFIPKPFENDYFVGVIRAVLTIRRSQELLSRTLRKSLDSVLEASERKKA